MMTAPMNYDDPCVWEDFEDFWHLNGFRMACHRPPYEKHRRTERIHFSLISNDPYASGDIYVDIRKVDGKITERRIEADNPLRHGGDIESLEQYEQAVHDTCGFLRTLDGMVW